MDEYHELAEDYKKIPVKDLINTFEKQTHPVMRYKQLRANINTSNQYREQENCGDNLNEKSMENHQEHDEDESSKVNDEICGINNMNGNENHTKIGL